MGEALSLKKVQGAIMAVVVALVLGCAMMGAQQAYASDVVPANDVEKGAQVSAGSGAKAATYTVTNTKSKTVTYKAPKSKSAKSVTVPATVKIGGKSYKVTAIAANAFKNDKKVTKITIGKNVKTIGKNAFKGAKKLKTITVRSTSLTKKGVKGALKGSSVKTVKVPKAKVKAYKKIFTKTNCGKKVTVK